MQSLTLQLKLLIQQINFIEQQVHDVEIQIKQLLHKINTPITTIPGIGDIERFSNPSKLVACAGIDASVHQSGDYISTNNKMSNCEYKVQLPIE